MIRDDDWRRETQPPARDAWVGYTFFRDVNPDPTAGTLTSTSSSSTTKGQGDRTSSSMSSSLTSGPPPMPGIAEHGLSAAGLPQDVRMNRPGHEPEPEDSVSELSTGMTEVVNGSLGGYGQRLRGHQLRGEVEGSGTSGDSQELSLVSEEIDRGWDYDPAYWAQGPGGHDGTTLDDDVRDDWLAFMRDLTVDVETPERNRQAESESSSAERPDWRRTLAVRMKNRQPWTR